MLVLTLLLSLLNVTSARSFRKHHRRHLHQDKRPPQYGFENLSSPEDQARRVQLEVCPGCSTDPDLILRKLHDRDAVCNDGSNAGYYIRKVKEPWTWVIYLQGGFYCNDVAQCGERQRKNRDLTGSDTWPTHKRGQGILSTDHTINPLAWGSNLVYIPYCTSDLWIGDSSVDENEVFHFRGAKVIERVIEALIEDGMREANNVLVTGTSAGGVGVMFHIDKIAGQLKTVGSKAEVRGISDSGWFIETGNVPEQGNFRNWQVNKTIGKDCLESNKDNQWKCLYGINIYPRITSPLMIVQFYYDTVQMQMNGYELEDILSNIYRYRSNDNRLKRMIDEVRSSLGDLDTVFGVSCLGHGILDNTQKFSEVNIRGVTLMNAIECWYMGLCPKRNMDICEASNDPCNESCMLSDFLWPSMFYYQKDGGSGWGREASTKDPHDTTWRPYSEYQYFTVKPNT